MRLIIKMSLYSTPSLIRTGDPKIFFLIKVEKFLKNKSHTSIFASTSDDLFGLKGLDKFSFYRHL